MNKSIFFFTTKLFAIVLLTFLVAPQNGFAKERISMNFSYENNLNLPFKGRQILKEGESLKKEFGRGDIDTVLTLTPHVENSKEISVEINIKNFREGDLISESTEELKVQDGQLAHVANEDLKLQESYKISITPKTLK